jgi:uncharacterized protein (UPF0147 family)
MESDESSYGEQLQLSATQLRGKQSVRATFRLSAQMIDLLKIAANHLEVQQKSLIDELVQNRETLDRVAKEAQEMVQESQERRQKTFVLSRNALRLLDDISDKHNLSRDQLVELCISRLIPFVDAEQEKHTQRRLLIKEVNQFLENGKSLLEQADSLLGADDRFREKLEKIVNYTERNINELREHVKEKQELFY